MFIAKSYHVRIMFYHVFTMFLSRSGLWNIFCTKYFNVHIFIKKTNIPFSNRYIIFVYFYIIYPFFLILFHCDQAFDLKIWIYVDVIWLCMNDWKVSFSYSPWALPGELNFLFCYEVIEVIRSCKAE